MAGRPKALAPLTTLTVKIPVGLRLDFIAACQLQDTTASKVVRDTVRDYLCRHPLPASADPLNTSS